MEVTRKLAEFIRDLTFEKLPPPVVAEAKLCILDWLGVTLTGSKEPLVNILLSVAEEEGGAPRATIIGRPEKASLLHAALINGSASHALEFDDVHSSLMGHPTVAVLPAVMALGQSTGASGKDLITAFVAGFETACHVGLFQTRRHPARGWHTTATIGHFGSAAACANLLRLDIQRTVYALGISGTQASGLKQVFGTMCKPFNAGKVSMDGILAALLAEKGFTSAVDIIEGQFGFNRTFTPDGNPGHSLEELGQRYQILDVMFKRHASCFGTHPSIDAALAFRDEGLTPEDIKSVHVFPYHGLYDVLTNQKPVTGLEGKFSIPYAFAVAFVKGRGGEACFTNEAVMDAEVIRVMEKVSMEKDESMPPNHSVITLTTQEGKTLNKHIDVTQAMKSQEEKQRFLVGKFRECAASALPEESIEQLHNKVMHLEECEDLNHIMDLCGEPKPTFRDGQLSDQI